jgi:putative IMPACT (imprinted ancient) family translation regulator
VEYTYPFTAEVMRLVTEFELNIEKQEFTDACRMEVSLALRHESKFLEKVERMKQIGISITVH